jgi:hypothetical protein
MQGLHLFIKFKKIMRNLTILKTLAAVVLAAIVIISMLKAHDNIVQIKDEQTDSLEKLFNTRSQALAEERLYVSTNQPIYNPGESIWFTVFLKNAQLKKSDKSDIVHVELLAPSGNVVQTLNLIARNGVCGGDFSTSASMAGGYYKVKAYTNWMRNENDTAAFEKEVLLQKVILPRVKMNLTFDKDSYTRGEEVISKFSVSTNENKPLRNKMFSYELKADGIKFKEGNSTTGDDGMMYVRYNLPAKLKTRDVQMIVKIEYDGLTESINKAVPVSSENISLAFFPEGGDLIAGLPARVAFTSTDEHGKAVSVEGVIKDSKGKEVCKLETYHKGMGSCYFTPQSGETYTASITRPKEISKTWSLPLALQHGFSMEVKNDAKDVQLHLRSTGMFKAIVIAQVRGKIYFSTSRVLNEGNNVLNIPVNSFPAGVAQITVFDQQMIPRAERLVFVNRDRQMQISIQTEREQYQSRDKVKTTIRTLDENGNPVPAIVSAKVVNDQLLSYADDKSSNLLASMLMEYDLKEKIDEPNFYFDKSEPKANAALDLVMMTSGWRRFTWKQVLNKEIPMVKQEGELAMFSIQVVDGYSGKPIPDAQLKLKSTGSVYNTDKNGKALFTNIDLYDQAEFTVTAAGYMHGSVTVNTYGQTNTVWLYNKNYMLEETAVKNVGVLRDRVQMVPQMNGMVNEQEGMFAAPLPIEKKFVQKDKLPNKPTVNTVVLDTDAKKDKQKNEDIVVADNRLNGIFKLDSIVENNKIKVTTYYRTREFPVKKYSAASNYTRNDFASTLFFKHAVETDSDGKAVFEFSTNDLITSFKIIAEGISVSGLAGRGEKLFFTQLPVTISSKTPGTFTSGDALSLPVLVKNNSSKTVSGKLSIKFNDKVFAAVQSDTTLNIAPQTAQVVYRRLTALPVQMYDTLVLSFNSSDFSDETTVPVKVESRGFPVQQSFSGRDLDRTFSLRIKDALPGSVKVSLTAYPSTVSTILKGISGLLRRPGGCFEQTSMSSYPNAMIMDYLKNSESGDEKVYAQAKELLTEGYNKLVTFETKQKGYEWFGAAPGHEALTAYGLMQFNEYKKLYSGVDESMIKRTADWLMARRDGKGGYQRDGKALDYFGRASEEVTNVYITYALSESGYGDIQKEVDYAYQTALASSDPYVLALVANTLYNKKDVSRANTVLDKLLKSQTADGAVKGAKQSITCSTGQGLDVETTALSLLAMMQSSNPDYVKTEKAASYLVNARGGYGDWGNTQATILALKALSKFSLFSKRTTESGTITVYLNDEAIGEAAFKAGDNQTIEIHGLEKYVKEGSHSLKIKYKGCKVALPYSVNVTYNIALPPSSDECDVKLHTSLNTKQCKVGDVVRMTVAIENLRNEGKPSTTAIIGIPAGLSIQSAALKALQEQNKIAYFEIWDNNLVIYLRQMKPEETVLVPVDLKAEVPGVYEAAASNVFLYYTSEYKNWVAGEQITISK